MFQLDGFLFYFLSTVLLVLVASIISFRRKSNDRLLTRLLAFYFWAFAIGTLITWGVLNPEVLRRFPHLFRSASFAILPLYPVCYFYVRRKLLGKGLSWWDLGHFWALAIFVIDFFPFLISSADEKWAIYQSLDNNGIKLGFTEGWFMPAYGQTAVRFLSMLVYWILQLRILWQVGRDVEHPYQYESNERWNWIRLFVYSQAVAFIVPVIVLLFKSEALGTGILNFSVILVSVLQCYFLLFHPTVLYAFPLDQTGNPPPFEKLERDTSAKTIALSAPEEGVATMKQSESDSETDSDGDDEQQKGFFISDEDLALIDNEIKEFLQKTKSFTKPRYSIAQLALESGIASYRISMMVNKRHGVNFYGYINRFRLAYFDEKIQSEEHLGKTLEGLSQECGFQSRTTFIRAFKNAKGVTPSEYLDKLKETNP